MRRSDTALIGIGDEQWARGIAKIRQARDRGEQPWLLGLDLQAHGGSLPRLVAAAGARIWSPAFRDVTSTEEATMKAE